MGWFKAETSQHVCLSRGRSVRPSVHAFDNSVCHSFIHYLLDRNAFAKVVSSRSSFIVSGLPNSVQKIYAHTPTQRTDRQTNELSSCLINVLKNSQFCKFMS